MNNFIICQFSSLTAQSSSWSEILQLIFAQAPAQPQLTFGISVIKQYWPLNALFFLKLMKFGKHIDLLNFQLDNCSSYIKKCRSFDALAHYGGENWDEKYSDFGPTELRQDRLDIWDSAKQFYTMYFNEWRLTTKILENKTLNCGHLKFCF